MAISFQCECGRKFRTADEHAGRSATCPQCGVKLMVPAMGGDAQPLRAAPPPVPDDDPPAAEGLGYNVESEEVTPVARRPAAPVPYGRAGRDRDDRDDDYNRKRPNYRRDLDADRFIKRPPTRYGGGMTDKGAIAGILMMVGAVVWFVVGLGLGIIFFYPPVLFIIGLICFFKGLMNRG